MVELGSENFFGSFCKATRPTQKTITRHVRPNKTRFTVKSCLNDSCSIIIASYGIFSVGHHCYCNFQRCILLPTTSVLLLAGRENLPHLSVLINALLCSVVALVHLRGFYNSLCPLQQKQFRHMSQVVFVNAPNQTQI